MYLKKSYSSENLVVNRIKDTLSRNFGVSIQTASKKQLYKALAITVREKIMDKWSKANGNPQDKQLYYLSIEFLMGRALSNNILNIGLGDEYRQACEQLGLDFDEIASSEPDAGLGNGGLGRLAACFIDSLATLDLPAQGCGIRYEYGLFRQKIIDGSQVEYPDTWLEDGNVWEVERPEEKVEVHFGGHITESWEGNKLRFVHSDYTTVIAVPYDMPIVGYENDRVNSLRLWKALSPTRLDMTSFNRGEYLKAVEEKEMAEVLSHILYPEDRHYEGKSLRLKQQYFFVSATIQTIVRRFDKLNLPIEELPNKATIHINDTHPALAIPELMRILMDEKGLDWDSSWNITKRMFAYTNHTIMVEALEKWPEDLIKQIMPRVYSITKEINERFCKMIFDDFPEKRNDISKMAIISYGQIAMAPLCIAGSYSVNGVSMLHSAILKNETFSDYNYIFKDKFTNVTNGVTHRRWLMLSNPQLTQLISSKIGEDWIREPMKLKELEKFAKDKKFLKEIEKVKLNNKKVLAKYILENNGIEIDPESVFDVHVKRLHEYKRQLLNILRIIYNYISILDNPEKYKDARPLTYIFGAKAAPGYNRAKVIIKLINDVAHKINNDPRVMDKLKVVFLENYSVSLAQIIFPASDISQQISTASKEASGTGNMKFMLNGALTLGTMDGANVEIFESVGKDNIFIFGYSSEEVHEIYRTGNYNPHEFVEKDPVLKRALDMLIDGSINSERINLYREIYDSLVGCLINEKCDTYLLMGDFESYKNTHQKMMDLYEDRDAWNEKAVINIANGGRFSSDNSIANYNKYIWKLK